MGADSVSIATSGAVDGVADCSSFVKKVVQSAFGSKLPRTAQEQYSATTAVLDPKPGDLVFFKDTYKKGISHVGIYVDRCRFIHNSRPAVKWGNLCSGYFARGGAHFAGVRRIRSLA